MKESLEHLDKLAAQQWLTTQELVETQRLIELVLSQETKQDYVTMAFDTLKG